MATIICHYAEKNTRKCSTFWGKEAGRTRTEWLLIDWNDWSIYKQLALRAGIACPADQTLGISRKKFMSGAKRVPSWPGHCPSSLWSTPTITNEDSRLSNTVQLFLITAGAGHMPTLIVTFQHKMLTEVQRILQTHFAKTKQASILV